MRTLFILIGCVLSNITFAQTPAPEKEDKNISTYVMGQYNKFFFEHAISNDPLGVGIGIETFFLTNRKLQFSAELFHNQFIDKAIINRWEGIPEIKDFRGVTVLLAGATIHPMRFFYFGYAGGAAYVNGEIYFASKSNVGFYFDRDKKWTLKLSTVGIHKFYPVYPIMGPRMEGMKEGIGYLQAGVGYKIF